MSNDIADNIEAGAETIGEALGFDPVGPAKPFVAPRLEGQPMFPEPGIYFGMDESFYHSILACSASGIKHMSASSMNFWAASVLNPDRDESETESMAKALGRAYHCRICEGAGAYGERYAVELDKADFAGLVVTIKDIRATIEAYGGKPKGTDKSDLIQQLLALWPDAPVWDVLVEAHAVANKGKTMIAAKQNRRIQIAAAMIEKDPQLKDAFTGGHAEVSLFWHDEATGAPMKARLDYLKLLKLVDLKSFANMQGKPVQRAIDMAISNQKYFIPVVVYLEAIAAVKKLVREGNGDCIHADGCEETRQWAWKWAHQPEPEVIFVFQQTGVAPVTRGRIMGKGTTYTVTNYAVQFLKRKWAQCAQTYACSPWIDSEPITTTEDEAMGWAATDFGETN